MIHFDVNTDLKTALIGVGTDSNKHIISVWKKKPIDIFIRGDSQLMPIYASEQNVCSPQTPSPLLKANFKWLFLKLLSSNPSTL